MNGNVTVVFYVLMVECLIERVGVAIITRCVLTVIKETFKYAFY